MDAVAPFQYRALEPGQIRILDLAPDTTARIRHVDLQKSSSAFKYVALSYTRDLPVRQNLLLALGIATESRLRRTDID
jgi:hypothetical protein